MSRAILDSSADTPQDAAGGFADLEPLDQELASQLPKWDLVPPHTFLARKPRKPKPVVVEQPPIETAPAVAVAVEPTPITPTPAVETGADPAPPAAEVPTPEIIAEAETEEPITDIEVEHAPPSAVHTDNCRGCGVPLEPGSAFCPECGYKQ